MLRNTRASLARRSSSFFQSEELDVSLPRQADSPASSLAAKSAKLANIHKNHLNTTDGILKIQAFMPID